MNTPSLNYASRLGYEADTTWLTHLEYTLESGMPSSPRGMAIIETFSTTSVINMRAPVITNAARKMSYRFLAGEAWWILAGRNDVASIAKYNKRIAQFSDDGQTFFGAYGTKATPQMTYVVNKLKEDPDSRQAVINIWRECPPSTKDVPCTTTIQWMIRNGELHCFPRMRSNDLFLGYVYDIFNFSMLTARLAIRLRNEGMKVKMGLLHLSAGSSHIYFRDWEAIKACRAVTDKAFEYAPLDVDEFPTEMSLVNHLKHLADCEFDQLEHRWLSELQQYYAAKAI